MGIIKRYEDSPIFLEPIEHVYFDKVSGEKFTSVTKVLHSFEPPFESEKIAESISKQSDNNPRKNKAYIGMSKDEILDLWQQMNDEANEYGTYVHETMENYLLSQKKYIPNNDLERAVIKGYEAVGVDEGEFMYPERVMFSRDHKLAGTSDIIVDIDDEWFEVGDFKTNKEFNFYSPYNKLMLHPLNHLTACQYSIYTLQLSVYAYMYQLEAPHKKCRQMYVLYWDKKNEIFSKIPIMYMKNEARQILETHKINTLLV